MGGVLTWIFFSRHPLMAVVRLKGESQLQWFELCENPSGVTAYYRDPPSLNDVVLRELDLMDGSPSVHFWFELPTAPDQRWSKWDHQNDVATIVLAMGKTKNVCFEGWGQDSRGSFQLKRLTSGELEFSFESNWFNCSGKCENVMIEAFRASRRR